MQAQDAHGISLTLVIAFCVASWTSGAIFGWGLRETRSFIAQSRRPAQPRRLEPLLPPIASPDTPPRRRRSAPGRRRRGGGYYFSEEARGWGDGRWRRRAGWTTVGLIVVLLGGSAIVAAANYKPTHLPPAGARR